MDKYGDEHVTLDELRKVRHLLALKRREQLEALEEQRGKLAEFRRLQGVPTTFPTLTDVEDFLNEDTSRAT